MTPEKTVSKMSITTTASCPTELDVEMRLALRHEFWFKHRWAYLWSIDGTAALHRRGTTAARKNCAQGDGSIRPAPKFFQPPIEKAAPSGNPSDPFNDPEIKMEYDGSNAPSSGEAGKVIMSFRCSFDGNDPWDSDLLEQELETRFQQAALENEEREATTVATENGGDGDK